MSRAESYMLHPLLTGWHRNRYPSEGYVLYMEIAMAVMMAMAMAMAMVFVVVLLLCSYGFSAMPFSVAGN